MYYLLRHLKANERGIVEALNHHFVSVGQKLADQLEQISDDDPLKHIIQEESSMSFTLVGCNYVRKTIQQLNNGKARRPDKIPVMLIKDVTDPISQPLTKIFDSPLRKGVFPEI